MYFSGEIIPLLKLFVAKSFRQIVTIP